MQLVTIGNFFWVQSLKISIGKGLRTQFWIDNWCDQSPIKSSFPFLFRLAVDKRSSVASFLSQLTLGSPWRRALRSAEYSAFAESMLLADLVSVSQGLPEFIS